MPRLAIPAELDDPAAINAAIVETAAKARQGDESVIVHVDYIDRGDDLVSVSADGIIEAVSDGAPTV